ncbi:MAG: twin transmembrane helix small protein [Woeseiaceae bacterium]|nr:twin transmembrane helix small protein [Woeseiaceae bacterium]
MKLIVLILLAAIVVSLFSGLFFLVKDKDATDSKRLLTSLKIRVALSISLILVLVGSYLAGWIA